MNFFKWLRSFFPCWTPSIRLTDLCAYTDDVEIECVQTLDGDRCWSISMPKMGVFVQSRDIPIKLFFAASEYQFTVTLERAFYALHHKSILKDRQLWIWTVAYIWAERFGDDRPNRNLYEWAEAMASTYFDDLDDRVSPRDAVDEEASYV